MEKSINIRFAEIINNALKAELANRQAKDEAENRAQIKLKVRGVFNAAKRAAVTEFAKSLDGNATLSSEMKDAMVAAYANSIALGLVVKQAKDYTFVDVNIYENGVSQPLTVSQRCQMTREEYDSLADIQEVNDVTCTAGIAVVTDKEGATTTRTSFKWDAIVADGEETKPSGPVRKFHEDTNSYDAPIYEPAQ